MFKPPTEKDIDKNLNATEAVKALYAKQWGFYRDGYYKLLQLTILQFLIIFILCLAIMFWGLAGTPEPKFFAKNAKNEIAQLYPLHIEQKTNDQVRQFVTDAVLEAMNFTYDDYKMRLQKAATYFTDKGFYEWDTALDKSTIYAQLVEKKLLLRTVLTSVPIIDPKLSRAYGDKFIWVLEVDVKRSITDKAQVTSKDYRYKISVQQVPVTERASGLAIYSIKEIQ